MKIAIIGHKRIPSREGGIEIVVKELAERMAAMGHTIEVYNRHTNEPKLKEYKGARILEIPTVKKQSLNAMVYSVFAALRALFGRYDVIHFHAEGPSVMLILPHLLGIRTVATIHGLDWQRAKWGGFATKYLLLGEKIAATYADELIVLSKNMQAYFKTTYNRDTRLIPNGIPTLQPLEAKWIKEQYGLEKHSYILFLARITPEKGLDYLIDAFQQLDTDKKLVIAGRTNPETDYIKSIKEKVKQDNRILMTGFVEGQELEELFSNCFCYVLPSDVEGMPISLLEAVGLGARCVVSDIPENTETVGSYAHTFPKGDTARLRDTLNSLLSKENLYAQNFREDTTPEKVQQQLTDLVAKYSWDAVTAQTLWLYKKE